MKSSGISLLPLESLLLKVVVGVITAEVVDETNAVTGAEIGSVDFQRSSTLYAFQPSMPDTIKPVVVSVVPIVFVCLYVQFMSIVALRSQASIMGQNLSIQQARVVNVQLLGL